MRHTPYIIFKGKNQTDLNKLKSDKYIMNNKIFITINNNAWFIKEIINDWFDRFYFPYINKDPFLGTGLLIVDKASSHIDDAVIEKYSGNLKDVSICMLDVLVYYSH